MWGKVSKYIPAPLKVFGCISIAAAATVILAPAIIILAVPPMICGAWLLHRRNRFLSSVVSDLHNRRWQDMASFHLQKAPFSANSQRIPTVAKMTVERSIAANEQGIASQLALMDVEEVTFGPLLSLAQDFRLGPSGGSEQMSVSEYALLVRNRQRGIVRVVSRGDADEKLGFMNRMRSATNNKTRIEVELDNGRLFVLQASSVRGDVLEGHGHEIK